MSYAIVGFGKIGQALAHAFARKNIEVTVASRRPPEALAPEARAIGPTVVANLCASYNRIAHNVSPIRVDIDSQPSTARDIKFRSVATFRKRPAVNDFAGGQEGRPLAEVCRRQMADKPPSTHNSTPFTKLASSEARNSATVAISSG